MKEEVFFGEGMAKTKTEYPDLYKAQKLIAIGINAAASDDRATKKQMMSGMKELGITKDEIVDVLRVVLLTSGMPPFTKGMKILYEILEK
jgi:alkylhydroperoxidase/carboxymuconolactone decarboxylase family protein YurZ